MGIESSQLLFIRHKCKENLTSLSTCYIVNNLGLFTVNLNAIEADFKDTSTERDHLSPQIICIYMLSSSASATSFHYKKR